MPKNTPWLREPTSAFDVVLIDLSLFAQAARAQGDMSNYYRFLQVQRESRLLHLASNGGPAKRGPRAAAGRGGAPRSGDEARQVLLPL